MNTYWDISQQERSELTEEQVKEMLNVELMVAGVRNPKPPVLQEVQKSPLGERKPFFQIISKSKYGSDQPLDAVFETAEKAQRFIELVAYRQDYDYEVGSEFQYGIPITDCKIQSVELYTLDQINQYRSELKSRKAKAESNEKQLSEFRKASEEAEKVTEKVWSDWAEQKERRQRLSEIVARFREYVKLTGGDETMAMVFLQKAHKSHDIAEAKEWFPGSLPELPIAQSEPEPVPPLVAAKEESPF